MAARPSVDHDIVGWMRDRLEQASPDLLREMVQAFAEALMGAEAEALCGAGYRERSGERTNSRNGYRARAWDTPGWAVSSWRSRRSALAATSRTGCWSGAAGRRRR